MLRGEMDIQQIIKTIGAEVEAEGSHHVLIRGRNWHAFLRLSLKGYVGAHQHT
jgi:hypothetical protein